MWFLPRICFAYAGSESRRSCLGRREKVPRRCSLCEFVNFLKCPELIVNSLSVESDGWRNQTDKGRVLSLFFSSVFAWRCAGARKCQVFFIKLDAWFLDIRSSCVKSKSLMRQMHHARTFEEGLQGTHSLYLRRRVP